MVVDREDDASTFRRLDGEDLRDWLKDYSLGDLWKMNVFGGRPRWTEVVVVCEGQTFPEEPSAGEREGTTPRTKRKGDRHPLLSNRRNIVVIADEAHRSQYDFVDGYARHMRDALPSASFIGFTGTPVELADANTRAVFGDHISVYDIQRAVEGRSDGAHLLREPPRQAGPRRAREADDSMPASRK